MEDIEIERLLLERYLGDIGVWVAGDCRIINITDLDDRHLSNIILGLSNGKTYCDQDHKLQALIAEETRRLRAKKEFSNNNHHKRSNYLNLEP